MLKEEMIEPIIKVSPGFIPVWNNFLDEWKSEKDLPLYLLLNDLARHISKLFENGNLSEVKDIFAVVEKWLLDGDSYVQEAATVGLLEDLQNTNVVGVGMPQKFEQYMLPETKRFWDKVHEFWGNGQLITDE